MFTDKELEVAEILLDLPHLISLPQKSPAGICNWGVKRRRTAIDQDDDDGYTVKFIPTEVKLPELNSPSTPLSFALAESQKSKRSCRKYIDRTKQELLELMNELNQCKNRVVGSATEGLKKSMDPTKSSEVSAEKAEGPFKCPDLNLFPTEIDCGLMA